jgi:S-DNA-T family DNA segregation ATPase FtsK/SpoIIIE
VGWIGRTVATPLVALVGWVGALLLVIVGLIALSISTIGWNPAGSATNVVQRAAASFRGWIAEWRELRASGRRGSPASAATSGDVDDSGPADEAGAPPPASPNGTADTVGAVAAAPLKLLRRRKGRRAPSATALEDIGDPESTDVPPLSLLSVPPSDAGTLSESELDQLGDTLIRTLKTFKVEGEIGGRTTGPVVTQFEVVPAPGVKVNRIAALDADLALALKAPSIRIVAPIPGKGAVGVEVPNP